MTARHGHSAEWLRAQLTDESEHYATEAEAFAQEAEEHDAEGDRERAMFKRGCLEYARAAHNSMIAMLAGRTRFEALAERLRAAGKKAVAASKRTTAASKRAGGGGGS